MEPIGIRPTNDFAFKKTLGTQENKVALMSLINAILNLPEPIVDLTIQNPFLLQNFKDDKLSVLDIRAVDQRGMIFAVEMQLSVIPQLLQRLAFYASDLYQGQLQAGKDYEKLRPVYTICLLNGRIWSDSRQVHEVLQFTRRGNGAPVPNLIEIHTLQLGLYNLSESELPTASVKDRWLFWLLNAGDYDRETLWRMFPDHAFRMATDTISRIAAQTEDKLMYDSREMALADQRAIMKSMLMQGLEEGRTQGLEEGRARGRELGREEGREEGLEEGELYGTIRTLQLVLHQPVSTHEQLQAQPREQLEALAASLKAQIR